MSEIKETVELEVANRHLHLKCHPEHAFLLKESARQLNDKITQVKNVNQVTGQDRTILMAALSLIHELNLQNQQNTEIIDELEKNIKILNTQVSGILSLK